MSIALCRGKLHDKAPDEVLHCDRHGRALGGRPVVSTPTPGPCPVAGARRVLALAAASLLFAALPARGEAPAIPATSDAVKSLGGERYQIGKILLDRKARQMSFPARVHVFDKPLEYLLTAPNGMKEYESLLEADVSGTEFNLACILLGLERDPHQGTFYQFSKPPLAGPRVAITVALPDGGSTKRVDVAELLFDAGSPQAQPVEWVYVGSQINAVSNEFAAQVAGTLIGFVHDPNSVIESVNALGVGSYGSINGNDALLPPVGTEVEISITAADGREGKN